MTTQDILNLLVSERKYQKRRWGFRQPDGSFEESKRTVGEYMVYMQDYLTEAFHAAAREEGDYPALDVLRKVVALGVRCFEEHGVPSRDLLLPVINARDGLEA